MPAHNEAASIREAVTRTLAVVGRLDHEVSLLVVDDGSDDRTLAILDELAGLHPAVSFLALSRQFGKEGAILAGLRHADGDAVIVMDSDLQHPPELIPQMVKLWLDGIAVVSAVRTGAQERDLQSRGAARAFQF